MTTAATDARGVTMLAVMKVAVTIVPVGRTRQMAVGPVVAWRDLKHAVGTKSGGPTEHQQQVHQQRKKNHGSLASNRFFELQLSCVSGSSCGRDCWSHLPATLAYRYEEVNKTH